MKPLLIAPVAALLLSACQTEAGGESQPDTCGAAGLTELVGTPHMGHDFTDPDRKLRIIPPNSAITMDYLETRLNVDIDEDGVIIRFWCG